MIFSERKFVQANALFWGCHKLGDMYKECRGRRQAGAAVPTYLYDDSVIYHDRVPHQNNSELRRSNPISHCIEVKSMNCLTEPVSHSLIVLLWIHHEDNQVHGLCPTWQPVWSFVTQSAADHKILWSYLPLDPFSEQTSTLRRDGTLYST